MSSSIKERITKKCHSDPRVTIDTLHSNIIESLPEKDKIEYYLDNGKLTRMDRHAWITDLK